MLHQLSNRQARPDDQSGKRRLNPPQSRRDRRLGGESGCGKSTLGRSIVGLEKPQSGPVVFDGVDLGSLSGRRLREARRAVQYGFQDPYASLNDRQTVGEAINEALIIAGLRSQTEREARITELPRSVWRQRSGADSPLSSQAARGNASR
ncbi:ATP-binding cassette domain-containing protein [Mesorhizobium sp. M0166]|uniref:ATP-binding cassette domain-containing protein n=1 Tax=Mesorhizobium sp. M0166 TaxID=2956902 RepID=UPI0033365905